MNYLTIKELDDWYCENIGEFDQEQAEVIEKLVEHYNPPIESEDSTESKEDTYEYIKNDVLTKQAAIKKEIIDTEKSIKYVLQKLSYKVEMNRINVHNKLSELMDEQTEVINKFPVKPKKPKCMVDESEQLTGIANDDEIPF